MSESAQRWRTLEDLYQAAMEREPSVRTAFLSEVCPDESVRREVVSLLNARSAGDELLERSALRYAAQSLEPDAMLGQYLIEKRIGAGGMGEVYRATDTRLGRAVALKVLPAVYAQDPEWLARFEREARVLASLNHPHIAAIYGLEESTPPALAMELVGGPTLAERLARGQMPLEEVLAVAKSIAEALEHAHEKGIIHRDLKPANIKITADGVVKVLDFGLAKAAMLTAAEDSPKQTATKEGVVLGTPAYMPPEQAKGLPVDKRADIWAFGVVLFEMLAGRPVFRQATSAEVLAALVHEEPPWQELPTETPAALRKLLKRCLEKDPKRRLRDIGEARIAIEKAQSGEPPEPAANTPTLYHRRWMLATTIVILLLIAALGAFVWTVGWFRPRPVPLGAGLFPFVLPEGTAPPPDFNQPELVPSPDGRTITFVAASQGTTSLWVQALDAPAAQRLDRTEDAHRPFWSPDGKSIAFFAGGQLKRTSMGGDPQTICKVRGGVGGTWNVDGTILFSPTGESGSGLMRVAASGGDPSPVTRPDAASAESAHIWPQFLPDGRHFLYLSRASPINTGIYVQELGSSRRTLVLNNSWPAAYASGYLLFVRQHTLFAQPFDPKRFQLTGEPTPVVPYLNADRGGIWTAFAASQNGVLAYRSDTAPSTLEQFTWYDRAGRALGTLGDVADYSNPALSPDGDWLAVSIRDAPTEEREIWLFNLSRGGKARLTSDPADDLNPVWSPDGSRIAFSSDRRGRREIYFKNPFGTAAEQLAAESTFDANAEDWSPHGIAYNTYAPSHYPPYDIAVLSLDTRKAQLYAENADHARFSPDGKWVAYQSPASPAAGEVYIQPFPATGARWQISTAGGNEPQWRGDGKELLYATGAKPAKIMAADIVVKNGAIQAGIPHVLFAVQLDASIRRNSWVVTRDGQKFLVLAAQEQTPPVTRFGVIYNWPALLEKR